MDKTDFHIGKTQSIREMQENFSLTYPFLKIEFLRKDHDGNHFSEGVVAISDAMTVSELESTLFDRFGLYPQVSRKSGNLWVAITKTKHWTLKQQNDQGKEILTFFVE